MRRFALSATHVIDRNSPVRVFKNPKRGCYSIMQRGVVRASARQVRLADVEFRVREAGRLRMLREKRKNVHAFAVGLLVDFVHPEDPRDIEPMAGRAVVYDPYRFAFFVDRETRAPVTGARAAHFDEHGVVYAVDETLDAAA